MPDVLVAELEGLRVVKNLLDVSFALSVGCEFVRSKIVCLLVEHVKVLGELEVRFLPLVVLLCFYVFIELLKDTWIPRINLNLKFYRQELGFL